MAAKVYVVTSGSRTRIRGKDPAATLQGRGLSKRIMISEILIIKCIHHAVELGTVEEIY